MGSDSISLIIIIVCVVMSAYFSATETAFSSLNRIRIKNMADKGNKKAALVLSMSENYDSLLSTILIGNNIVNILSASLATVLFVNLLGDDAGPTVSTVVTTVVVLIFGEISPKSIAKESPEKFAMFSAPILKVLVIILTPFNFLFKQWKKLLSLIFRGGDDKGITEEELISLVEEAEQEGGINEQESMLIRSAIDFTDTEVGEIITPRIDITALPVNSEKDEIARVFAETAYSRLPLYEESIDHIVGVIYQKDFHNYIYHTDKTVAEYIRPVAFVPCNKKIGILFKELQQQKSHIAVVVDEYGGTVGIITLEDILEELVGEIWDEHDEISNDIELLSDGVYIISGNAHSEKVFEHIGIDDDGTKPQTMGGWLMEKLMRIPDKGDVVEYKGYSFCVSKCTGKRVEELIAEKVKEIN